jgi:tetratricopeptide (TPR) repeat protein
MRLLGRLILILAASSLPLSARTTANPSLAQPAAIDPTNRPVQSAALKFRLAIESGNKLREKNNFDAALLAYQHAIRLQPESANALFYLGLTYVNLDQFEKASYSFKRSVLVAPDDPAKWMGLCLSHYLLGDFAETVHTCQEALRLDPKQADGWAWMGLGYAHQQEWDKSVPCLEAAAALGTKSSEAWYTLGIRYARQGQRTKVLKVYRRLQELDSDQAAKFFAVAVSPKQHS